MLSYKGKESVVHRALDADKVRQLTRPEIKKLLAMDGGVNLESLKRNLGLYFKPAVVMDMVRAANDATTNYAMDALQTTVTTPSSLTPVQFLQQWLTGFIEVITKVRKLDQLTGIMTIGNFEDEQIIQGTRELLGVVQPYSDDGNVPLTSFNTQYETRTNTRWESGMRLGVLADLVAARSNNNSGAALRESCALQLEIQRNRIGFFGYNSGANLTYGFLNDPTLPAYVPFAAGASTSTMWSTKTFLEICKDLRTMFAQLRTQAGDNFNPEEEETILALGTSTIEYLNVTSDFGQMASVKVWLKENYPKCKVISAPELDGANGGANVVYLYLTKVNDSSTDGGQIVVQLVPSKFKVIGVSKQTKGYEEDYAMATAGCYFKRVWPLVRYTGN